MANKMKIRVLALFLAAVIFAPAAVKAGDDGVTLEQCVETAMGNNHEYLGQKKREEEAGYKLFQQVTNVLPQIDASMSYYRYENELPSKKQIFGISNDDYYADISLKQVVFSGGKNIGLISAAAAGSDAEKARLELTKRNLIFSVKRAYYEFVKAAFSYDTQKELYNKLKEQANIAQLLYSGGKISSLDLLKIQTQEASAEDGLKNLQELKGIKGLLLGQAMGLSGTVEAQINLPEPSGDEVINAGCEAAGYGDNPDIIYSKKILDKSESEITAARADFFPTVYIRANYNMEDSTFFPGNPNWYAGVALTMPVFHWGGIFAQVKQAEARKEQAFEAQAQVQLAVSVRFRSAKASFYEKKDRLKTMKKIIALSKQALEAAELKYNSGKLSALELIDAQTVWYNAVLNYKNVMVEYYTAKAEIESICPKAMEDKKNEDQKNG